MQKDLHYCAIDLSKDKLDVDGAALALPAQLRLNASSVTKNSQNDARRSDECRLLYMSGKRDSSR
jgi:hypothetical protein